MKHIISTISRSITFITNHRIISPRFTPHNNLHLNLFPSSHRPTPAITNIKTSMSLSGLLGSFFGTSSTSNNMSNTEYPVKKTDDEWRAVLSPEQFRVIRKAGTEPAFSGTLDKHYATTGTYNCAACDAPLYTATHKFKSGCGWPAFFDAIPGAVERKTDNAYGMSRTEILCTNCGGHLGHVFKGEGYDTPTDERHCVNSVSLRFENDAGKKEEAAKV
jgi:peptide-methionine (R)-S-oxide reductase